jgi:DNA-binding NarL/FixJ family response regulator
MQTGAVYIIDDDIDDHHLINEIWKELNLPNQLLFFSSAIDMIDHLSSAQRAPFIIICDINLPKMDGFELRQRLLESGDKNFKSVPFIFWSTHASEAQISKAYDLSAHGFFIKGTNFEQMKESFRNIISYWQTSRMPRK